MELMLASGPPIASGYRGSRQIATLEEFYGPDEQKNRNRNNEKESAKKHGGTAHAATNLRSYLNQRIPEHYADRTNKIMGIGNTEINGSRPTIVMLAVEAVGRNQKLLAASGLSRNSLIPGPSILYGELTHP